MLIQLYKNAYSGLSKNSWYLSLVMFINRSGTMVVPFMSIYTIQQLHFTIVQSGWIMAFYGIGAFTGAFIGGKLTDKTGFYDVQVGALLLGGLLFIILGYQHTFISLSIGTFILSMCNESFRPANSAAIAHYSNDGNKTRSYSLNRLAINLGWAFGGGLGGLLASVSYHSLFWVDGCTNIFAALILLTLMPRAKIRKTVQQVPETSKAASAYKDKVYLIFILLNTLFSICFFEYFIMQPVFYKIQWHLTERYIGFLMALNGILIVIIEMILINKLEGKRSTLTYIVTGIAISGAAFVLLNTLPHNAWIAVFIVILITLGEIISMPFMNSFWISRTNLSNRGQYAAMYGMSWSAAQVIAPALGNQVIAYGGFNTLWWVLGGVCFFVAGSYFIMQKAMHPPKQIITLTDTI